MKKKQKMTRVSETRWKYIALVTLLVIAAVDRNSVEAQTGHLSQNEVLALREVAAQLGKNDWNFMVDPCSNDAKWATPYSDERALYNNTVLCNCSFTGGECHVVSIFLRGQDLAGVLPRAIVRLPYLKNLDLNRNYLSGNIPNEWTSTKLELLSVSVNRLTGEIPTYLGNMITLRYLTLETNMFFGTVPPQLGNLINLEILVISANNLTGTLPMALANLTKLTELRISSNNFSGKVPSFIGSLKSLEKLEIQASGFHGPIPSAISALNNLTELRISDLPGEGSRVPRVEEMGELKHLMLRDCNISGPITLQVGSNTTLRFLDLSFNKLEGNLSTDLDGLTKLENVYLTRNLLSGPIPDWIKNGDTRLELDLSYNNFTESSLPNTCRDTLNLFRSTSGGNYSKPVECLKNYPCSKDRYSLHINCGGGAAKVGRTSYEADEEPGAAAKYVPIRENWEISNTGHYLDKPRSSSDYIAQNSSVLQMDHPELYTRARLSPLSLTYFARCLANGNYSVKLHFAEIVIRDNRSFYSLGRRVFDVYIQENLVLKDFDIKKDAKGVDKVVIHEFKAVVVKYGMLEIRFHWSGKGTTAAPARGTYGPLISAIDIKSEFKPPLGGLEKWRKLIVVAAVLLSLLVVVLSILWWKCCARKISNEIELLGIDLPTGIFTYRQIKAATDNFDPSNKLGEGGFGAVYKGTLADGTIIAVKQLSSKSRQGNREFLNEVGMITALQHPNLVRLYGCCVEGNQLLLVYEYMENNSLANVLFEKNQLKLDWPMRQRICVSLAKGLAFLHEESALRIIHRDIKATNVLLDGDLNPKISDFGLAKLHEEENTHVITRVAGTIGYMAPEYALWGYLSNKIDVYSFGIVALEIVVGKSNTRFRPDENFVCLLDWAFVLQQKGNLLELIDQRLDSNFNKTEAIRMTKIALLCTNPSPALRPAMSEVVQMLEGKVAVRELVMGASTFSNELGLETLRNQISGSSHETSSESSSRLPFSDLPHDPVSSSSKSSSLLSKTATAKNYYNAEHATM